YETICGKGTKQKKFTEIEIETAAHYAAEEAMVTMQLHHYFWPKITAEKGLKYIFEKIEIPLASVLFHMEHYGVLIDAIQLKQQSQAIKKRLVELTNETFKISGTEFNMSSPKQLQEILFNKLKLPILQKTPTGQP